MTENSELVVSGLHGLLLKWVEGQAIKKLTFQDLTPESNSPAWRNKK
jgi:hypothetical protein